MSLAKAGRKLKRAGKTAVQFRFTSTFEYIDLECIGSWRPENLKVVWQRAHRKVESNNIQWVAVADRGPDGATGRALFDPAISVALIVTLYRDPKTTSFEEKVYKYYIEHEGALGKKVLASFHCDVAEYAGIPSTKSALELDCKPVSKKVRKAHIGVTLESEYIKEGVANDEDMQSTYSHMTTVGVVMDDHDSDEETFPLPSNGVKPAEHKETKLNPEKTMPTLVECSGTFEREPNPEKLRETEPREDKDSKLEREAVLHEKAVESCGQDVDTVASQPVTQRDSLLENEGLSQPTPEERDSQMEKTLLPMGNGEAVRDGQQLGLIVNGGSDVVGEQETQHGLAVSKEDEKTSMHEATVGGDNVVEQTGDDAPSHREDNGAETKVRDPDLQQSETGKADKQEVSSAQEIQPQEDLKLQEAGWVEAPPETNRKEDSCPHASCVMVTGGERQDSPLSPNEGMPKGEGVVASATNEAVQVTNRTEEGLDGGKSQTVKEMEGKSGTVVIDVAKAHTDPEAVKSQIQQQPSAELEGKVTGTVAAAANDTSLPSPKPEQERTLKGTQPEARVDAAVPQMSTAGSDKVEGPASQSWLPPTVQLVSQNGTPVPVSELDNKQIIGLYFTAQWCPPCRKFMPKLIKFYKVLKENNCRFHLIYVSSDHTEEDMYEYMQMQKVPFPAISFTSSVGDELRQKYGVHQVPHLVIINRDCQLVDEQARKSVEYAVTNTSAMQCYQDWLEGISPKNGRKTVSDGVHKAESPKKEQSTTGPTPAAAASKREESESAKSQGIRKTVQSQTSRGKTASSQELEEKLEYIRELEADKEALQLRVTEVTVANERLKSRVEELEERLKEVNSVQSDLLREKKDLAEQMNLRGWLMKRGVHGPTGRKWRRRFFRTDQGNQLCYYKGTTGEPQGWIDLCKVKDVRKASSETQDKNNLTFEVETEGRVYELLAENGPDMEKWMTAIKNLAEFCQSNVDGSQATPHP